MAYIRMDPLEVRGAEETEVAPRRRDSMVEELTMRITIHEKPKPTTGDLRVVRKFALLPIVLKIVFTFQKEIRWLEWCPIIQVYDDMCDFPRWKNFYFCQIDFDPRIESAHICNSFHCLCNLADKHNVPYQDVLKYNGLPRYDAEFTNLTVIRIPKEVYYG